MCGGLPDRIPRRIAVELVAANSRWIDLEPRVVDVIVVRVEHHHQLVCGKRVERSVVAVRVQELIPSRERSTNAGRAQRVIHSRPDVKRPLVVQDADLGTLGRWRAFIRLLLVEVSDRSRFRPGSFIELAVDCNSAHGGAAMALGRDADTTGVFCACNAPAVPTRNAAARTME